MEQRTQTMMWPADMMDKTQVQGKAFIGVPDQCNSALDEIEGEKWPPPSPLAIGSLPTGSDPINHPPHYTFGKYEVIDVIEDWGLSYHLGTVLKYVARAKHKGSELQDLRKAKFFLDRVIQNMEQGKG